LFFSPQSGEGHPLRFFSWCRQGFQAFFFPLPTQETAPVFSPSFFRHGKCAFFFPRIGDAPVFAFSLSTVSARRFRALFCPPRGAHRFCSPLLPWRYTPWATSSVFSFFFVEIRGGPFPSPMAFPRWDPLSLFFFLGMPPHQGRVFFTSWEKPHIGFVSARPTVSYRRRPSSSRVVVRSAGCPFPWQSAPAAIRFCSGATG